MPPVFGIVWFVGMSLGNFGNGNGKLPGMMHDKREKRCTEIVRKRHSEVYRDVRERLVLTRDFKKRSPYDGRAFVPRESFVIFRHVFH